MNNPFYRHPSDSSTAETRKPDSRPTSRESAFPSSEFHRDNSPSGGESFQSFPLAQLERKTDDYLARVRQEAKRIADQTREEIDRFRQRTEEGIAAERDELNAKAEELARLEEELTRREEELVRREKNLEKGIADESWGQGYKDGLDAGREDGFAEGKRDALANAEKEIEIEKERRLSELAGKNLPAIDAMVEQLGGVRQTLLAHWEKNILQIAAAIAHQTIRRELPKMKELPLDLLRESLELAIGCASVKIRMNPDDLKELRPGIETLLAEFSDITSTELIEDSRVTPGGCVLENALGIIDQRLETRLERIISELSK